MGGKSSKANDKFIDKALQQSQSERRRTPRSKTPPTPAWGKNSQRSMRENDDRNYDRERKRAQQPYDKPNQYDTSWGKTSFNTFDLHQYRRTSQSHQDLSGGNINFNKFADFHNITDKREEKEKRDHLKREDEARNKPNMVASSPKKQPFSVHKSSSKAKRRNSLPLDQNENKHPRNNKPYSRSSPQKKKLSVRQPDSAERRVSDVSTLSLSENTVPPNSTFKSLNKSKNNNYGGSKSSKAAVSIYGGKATNNNYSPRKRINSKQHTVT